jgi:hypothetical protein
MTSFSFYPVVYNAYTLVQPEYQLGLALCPSALPLVLAPVRSTALASDSETVGKLPITRVVPALLDPGF